LELLGLIEDYRQGLVPLIVPLTLLKRHLSCYPVPEWVHQQVYLHPYPKELMLRTRMWDSPTPHISPEFYIRKKL
jgi:uncharacterized protein YbgA (DUF1722 family)